ncbi:MAG: signal peptidase I, partial [Pseudomonadales bacterium]
ELREPLLVEYARSFFPVLLVVWALRSFVAEPFQIPSESMVPNLAIGDFVLVNKYAYGVRLPVVNTRILKVGEPRRGDMMVFEHPQKDIYLIKRVVGIPGDVIGYANQSVTLNGQTLSYEFQQQLAQQASFGQFFVREYLEQSDGREYRIHRYPTDVIRQKPPREWVLPAGAYFMMGDNRDRSEDSRSWQFAREEHIVGKAVAVWMHKPPGWHWPSFAMNRWLEPSAAGTTDRASAVASETGSAD